jgi:putative ABC transport system ATP-binding protein
MRMADNKQWLIEAVDLTRIYGDGEEIYALNESESSNRSWEFVAVMGPAGRKSTLFDKLIALDKPTRGKIYVEGQDLAAIRNKDAFRAKK